MDKISLTVTAVFDAAHHARQPLRLVRFVKGDRVTVEVEDKDAKEYDAAHVKFWCEIYRRA